MNTLLVPSDFSGCSQNALNFALLIAKSVNAGIKLLHVYPPKFDFASKSEEYESLQENDAEKKFEELEKRIRERNEFRHLNISAEVRKGEVISEIIRTAADSRADMIVMGTLGAGGIKEVIGSNTSEVIHDTYLPVLAIPANFRPDKIKRVVFATDLRQADVNILTTLSPIISDMNLPMEVVHVFRDKDEENEEEGHYQDFARRVREKIKGASITFHKINNYDVEKGLANLINGYDDALLALAVYKKDFFDRLLGQNVAEDMVLSASTPVLVLKGDKV